MSKESYKDSFRKPEELLQFAQLSSTDKVLDVTTGYGYLAKHMSKVSSKTVDVQNGSEWRGFFESIGIQKEIARMEKDGSIQHYWSSMEDPGLGKVNEYDLITMQNTFHDLYDMPVDRTKFFRSIRTALKPQGRFLLIDHQAGKGRGCRDAGANRGLHRIEACVVREELEQNGFLVTAQSDMFAFSNDNYRSSAWTNPMKNTDRFVLLCHKA
ncbi:Inherit from COG: Methyltransferase [Seminavis robusta]|uniref:Inherit from COG: Methyltransferase n=1 Tax=Seminavis robusta TaxID=568900 RepID=A0A9N8ET45_9STRA|nr:Inherit from COG: Methyltransferase [Seminavis robusta]|eukprot:Sro1693_g291670.1 Inherit from COG: Methyltransferase (212) ;mRNA; r:18367-19002